MSKELRWTLRHRVTSKGQVTVPKAVRAALNIKDGDHVAFRVEGNRAVLARTSAFLTLAGAIRVPAAKRNVAWDEVIRRTKVGSHPATPLTASPPASRQAPLGPPAEEVPPSHAVEGEKTLPTPPPRGVGGADGGGPRSTMTGVPAPPRRGVRPTLGMDPGEAWRTSARPPRSCVRARS